MSQNQVIIDGLPNYDLLQLQEDLDKESITSKKLTAKQTEQVIGKSYEFVSTTLLLINVTTIVLNVVRVWWLKKKKENSNPPIVLTIQMANGTSIFINTKGEIKKIYLSDGTVIAVCEINKDEREEKLKKIEGYGEILKSIKEITEVFK